MLSSKFGLTLLNQERGANNLQPILTEDPIKSKWSVLRTFNPWLAAGVQKSEITYVSGREDQIICLTSNGSAILSSESTSKALTERGDRAIKIFLNSSDLFMAVKRPTENFLRFYKVDLDSSDLKRHRLLEDSRFLPSDMKKVDSVRKLVLIERNSRLEVWDLESQSKMVTSQPGRTAWYSKFTLIETELMNDGTLIRITPLDSFDTKLVKIKGLSDIFQVEKIGQKVVIGSRRSALQVINLDTKSTELLSTCPPRFYMETEQMQDAFVVFQDGTAKFVDGRSISLEFKNPVFKDTNDLMVVLNEKKLSVIGKEASSHCDVRFGKSVTCVGVNEDKSEIYLGRKNGLITIFH